MKAFLSILALTLMISGAAIADHHETKSAGVSTDTSQAATILKKNRKKKVEMCSECGKPESECECHGKGKGKKHEHKEGEKHSH